MEDKANLADSLAWAHKKRVKIEQENDNFSGTPRMIIPVKPMITSNPITSQRDQPENMVDKVEKARQGLLLLKSKITRQTTFSSGNFKGSMISPANNSVAFPSATKPTLTASNFRKTFKPDFTEKKDVAKSISFNENIEHKLTLSPRIEKKQAVAPPKPSLPKVVTNNAPAPNKFSKGPSAEVILPIKQEKIIFPQAPKISFPEPQQSKVELPKQTPIVAEPSEIRDPETGELIKLFPCSYCNRKFNENALEKHKKICMKFDTAAQRLVSDEQEIIVKQEKIKDQKFNGLKSKKFSKSSAGAGINAKWKNKSELFRAAMKAARTGKAVEMPIDEDLHQCPHCKRTFNENAAHKHIKMCQERSQMMEHRMKNRKNKGPSLMTKPLLNKK